MRNLEEMLEAEKHKALAKTYLAKAKQTGHNFYRVSCAIEAMQTGRKRKLMIGDDAFDAYAVTDSGCLPKECGR